MLLILLGSCGSGLTQTTFEQRYATAVCNRMRECERGYWEAVWHSDQAECRDDVGEDLDAMRRYYDHCSFDAERAARCLDQLGSLSCGDLYEDGAEDCWDVYDCTGGGGRDSG